MKGILTKKIRIQTDAGSLDDEGRSIMLNEHDFMLLEVLPENLILIKNIYAENKTG